MEELPPATVTEHALDMKGLRLANHVPDKPVTLDFRPPEVLSVQFVTVLYYSAKVGFLFSSYLCHTFCLSAVLKWIAAQSAHGNST